MPDRTRRRRATREVLRGRQRALALSKRLGIGLRERRLAARLTQEELGATAGLSQAWISRMERGVATSASLESWASVASVLNLQLVAFLEGVPGASQPQDLEHLRRQELLLRLAAPGGWAGRPEAAVPGPKGSLRSIDVLLIRRVSREAIVCEVWDLLADVGSAMRGLDVKLDAVRRRLGSGWRVQGLWIVRGTRRNRALLAELPTIVRSRFPGTGGSWLACLGNVDRPMPDHDGLVWSDATGSRLFRRR